MVTKCKLKRYEISHKENISKGVFGTKKIGLAKTKAEFERKMRMALRKDGLKPSQIGRVKLSRYQDGIC